MLYFVSFFLSAMAFLLHKADVHRKTFTWWIC